MIDDYGFYEEPEEYEQYLPDSYFEEAQAEIRHLYEENKDSVFYLRQLQVKFEKKYFHWVTNNALIGLLKIRYLKDYRTEQLSGTSTRYFIHHSNRYPKRAINQLEEAIRSYSQDNVTRGCGHRAEDLFCKALALRGFMPAGPKINEYKGRRWTKTDHDLDFVFQRDGIEYGCEIKNTLGYIDKEELDIKIEMCDFLNIKPLFIMRYAPKPYIKLIYENGGFALLFETQIYELGQVELVEKIKEVTGMPVICTKSIPDGIIDRFEKWHKTKVKVTKSE
jgi:hypothetical protein